jgi:hypothetical protein
MGGVRATLDGAGTSPDAKTPANGGAADSVDHGGEGVFDAVCCRRCGGTGRIRF